MSLVATSMLIVCGLLLPGYGWAQLARWPRPWIAAAMLSWISIFLFVVGFDAVGIPLRLDSLGLALAGETLLGLLLAWRSGWRPSLPELPKQNPSGLLLLLAPAVGVSIWKAVQQPLASADTIFRWNHLAELLVKQGSLAHYPPITQADFSVYFWPDGIAPLASSLMAWCYLGAGNLEAAWTAVSVLVQCGCLYILLYQLGEKWGGPRAGTFACVAGAACFILQFAFGLAQETGLSTLGVLGMVFYLNEWEKDRRVNTLLAAAIGGAVAAVAREYAMLFPVLAGLWMIQFRGKRLMGLLFVFVALLPAGLWSLRNFLLTENPVYCMNAAGLFPVNPVFGEWMKAMASEYRPHLGNPEEALQLLRYSWIGMMPALLGLTMGFISLRKLAGVQLAAIVGAGVFACWWISIPLTMGGLFYSMRVLAPVLALGCAAAGVILARINGGRLLQCTLIAVSCIWILDASARSLTIPENPYRIPFAQWRDSGERLYQEHLTVNMPFLRKAAAASPGATFTAAAGSLPAYQAENRKLSPIWTPELAFLIDKNCSAGDAAPKLRSLGYSHLLLNKSPVVHRFFASRGVFMRIGPGLRPVMENEHYVLYELPVAIVPAQ